MVSCPLEKIYRFSSQSELRRFSNWMDEQIGSGIAEEVDAPADRQVITGERWLKHISSGVLWRLVPADGPLAPGFWPVENLARS